MQDCLEMRAFQKDELGPREATEQIDSEGGLFRFRVEHFVVKPFEHAIRPV